MFWELHLCLKCGRETWRLDNVQNKDMFIVYHCQNLTALAICLCVYTCNNSRTAEQSTMKL
jgi:hypothetical protein